MLRRKQVRLSRQYRTMTSVKRLKACILTALLLLTGLQSMWAEMIEQEEYELTMPNATPNTPEEIQCTSVRVDHRTMYNIVGFEPIAMKNAYHIRVYGCDTPYSMAPIYDCHLQTRLNNGFQDTNYCARGKFSQLLFSWGHDSEGFMLPVDVGFKIGMGTKIKYVVLQVEYTDVLSNDGVSGMLIKFTQQELPRQAGLLLFGTAGLIGPSKKEQMEVDCKMTESKNIYPIAFRVHTHMLGKVVTGYRVIRTVGDDDVWMLLGVQDPWSKQTFYPVWSNETITTGDILAVRCQMENTRKQKTLIGSKKSEEVCNFYLMYYTDEGEESLKTQWCYSEGAPRYYWKNSKNRLSNIPKIERVVL